MISETYTKQQDPALDSPSFPFYSQLHTNGHHKETPPQIVNGKNHNLHIKEKQLSYDFSYIEKNNNNTERNVSIPLVRKTQREGHQPHLLPFWMIQGSQELINGIELTVEKWKTHYPSVSDSAAKSRFKELKTFISKEKKMPAYCKITSQDQSPVPNPFTVELIDALADLYVMGMRDPKVNSFIEEDNRKIMEKPISKYELTGKPSIDPKITFIEADKGYKLPSVEEEKPQELVENDLKLIVFPQ